MLQRLLIPFLIVLSCSCQTTDLDSDDEEIKRFLFSANVISREEADYDSSWDDYHLPLTSRSYCREVKKD